MLVGLVDCAGKTLFGNVVSVHASLSLSQEKRKWNKLRMRWKRCNMIFMTCKYCKGYTESGLCTVFKVRRVHASLR